MRVSFSLNKLITKIILGEAKEQGKENRVRVIVSHRSLRRVVIIPLHIKKKKNIISYHTYYMFYEYEE